MILSAPVSEAETIRLIGEVIGVISIIGAGFWRLAIHIRQWAKRILGAVESNDLKLAGVNERLDKVNGNITRLSAAERELREAQAWLAGRLGEKLPEEKR